MNYEPKSIQEIIVNEINRTIFLPAIQREFVWGTRDIEKLFDSIMGDYPISSFLFLKIREENKKEWVTYEFIRDFDDESPINQEADLSGFNNDIHLVLDGQQRLSAFYIGLKGSYKYFYYRWRKTRLYLNLLKMPERNDDNPEELTYQFQFLETDQIENSNKEFWYEVCNILDFEDAEDAKENLKRKINHLDDEQKENANRLLGRLHSRIHTYKFINYYEEKSQDPDKIVEIFIRANTAGKKLDYSDILLSTATAKWKTLDARKEIQTFTEEINRIGAGYDFEKDFVLKGCLYLCDNLPIQYKVKNFTRHNLEIIENNWEIIKSNIESSVKLISKFGFSNKNIVASAALLPIAFYLMKLKKRNYIYSTDINDIKNQNMIQKWLIISLLKNAFGGSSDTTLKNLRETLLSTHSYELFPAKDLFKTLEIEPKFSEAEVENILKIQYRTRYSYLVLSLLYPDRDWKDNTYNEDHIFPKNEFKIPSLRKHGYRNSTIEEYMTYYNTIINLELLTQSENQEKYTNDFEEWLNTRDIDFKRRHSIPDLQSYSFDSFLEFVEERKEIIKGRLSRIAL